MKIRNRSQRVLTLDDDSEVVLAHEAVEGATLIHQEGNTLVVAYLVQDEDYENPLEDSCNGYIVGRGKYETRRHSESEMYEALAMDCYGDPDLGLVDQQVQERWEAQIDSLHDDLSDDTWALIVEDLGISDEEGEELKGDLKAMDIIYQASTFNALYEALSSSVSDDGFLSKATARIDFDVEAVQVEEWGKAVRAGVIGNPDAVVLDVYDHSRLVWSISGGGMNCRWDTSTAAGVWLPEESGKERITRRAPVYAFYRIRETPVRLRGTGNEYQLLSVSASGDLTVLQFGGSWGALFCMAEELQKGVALVPTTEELTAGRRAAAHELADQALDTYNAWLSGECYGCVVEVFTLTNPEAEPEDFKWEQASENSCWGFVGQEYAESSLRDEFYDGAVADLTANALAEI